MCSYKSFDSASGFDWDEANVSHIARHRVEPDEVEEAFLERNRRFRAREGRYILHGRSAVGRHLWVAFALRDGWIRVITAREMTRTEVQRYRREFK